MSDFPEILSPPAHGAEVAEVRRWAERAGLEGGYAVRTSGSAGAPKWVVLSRRACVASARAVNGALGARGEPWVLALPPFHVAGLAVRLRAEELGAELRVPEGRWHPARFVASAEGAGFASLVPAQVFDLVRDGLRAPGSLRAVLVGGGALRPELEAQAQGLGWPLRATYGMTETASTVAIGAGAPDGSLELLGLWAARTDGAGALSLRGEALCEGYLTAAGLERAADGDGWFATGDLARLQGRSLWLSGRSDAVVKVLGEKVDLQALQGRLEAMAGTAFAVVAVPDPRAGHRLLLAGPEAGGARVLAAFNREVPGFERLAGRVVIDAVPRSELGKVCRGELTQRVLERLAREGG